MLAIYGAGGFAHQLIDMAEAVVEAGTPVCFVDDGRQGDLFGIPIRPLAELDAASFVISVADPARRREIAATLPRIGSLVAGSARISRHCEIGEGAIIAHHCIVEAGVRIGRHFHGNIYSYVAHESEIGDFVTFAPRVNCNGRVRIGDGAYIGTGAFLKQGVTIGAGARIGMGCVVLHDIPDGATAVGNPARLLG